MKRLIPALIILIFTLATCLYSNITVSRACDQTEKDINAFENKTVSATKLEENWQKQKEKMSIFVNHKFLDDISIYVGQLTQYYTLQDNASSRTLENIKTTLYMIKEEQKLTYHSFY